MSRILEKCRQKMLENETSEMPYALVIDDQPLVARGFAEYLATHCGFDTVRIASNGDECLQHIEVDGCPALAVVDFWLPEGAALMLLGKLAQRCIDARLLVVSGDEDGVIQHKVREAGAHGFILKSQPPELFAQVVSVLRTGGVWFNQGGDSLPALATCRELPIHPHELGLTERQGQVLGMILRGLPNKRIALALDIAEQTVKEHVTNILAKLGVSNRMEVIASLRGRRIAS